jgi:5-methylcytosine-specific restriction enzyme subunit McrC
LHLDSNLAVFSLLFTIYPGKQFGFFNALRLTKSIFRVYLEYRQTVNFPYRFMIAPVTLFEYESTANFNWTDKDALKITRLNKNLGTDVLKPVFRAGKRELQATQYVGTLRFGKQSVQILPKIYRMDGHQQNRETVAREATENLLYLLSYAGKFPIRENEISSLARQTSDWFEILTRLFAEHLIVEWERGASRNYQTVEDELPVLKGKWQFNEQLRRPAIRHKFTVSFDEFTADNKLNRVFRFVVERLWNLTQDAKNRQLLGDLRMLMDEVNLLPHITVADASASLLSRMNSRFLPLLNLARLFLDNSAIQLSISDTESFAFVFDMNALFESFLIEFIRRHRLEILPEDLQMCDFLPQTKGSTRHLAHREERDVFQLKPDLAFQDKTQKFPLLVDAKYKRLAEQDLRLGVSQSDFYQMHAYAHRFECPRIVLIYPQSSENEKKLRVNFRLHNYEVVIQAATIDLGLKLSRVSERNKLISELKEIFCSNN